jgi:class 3 adenylate cyclase/tetratricopeptide (TPR) repeat protein
MDDLKDWLERHGLAATYERLAAADVGLDVLADLTERDLQELGLSLGERRRLAKAQRGEGVLAPPAPEPAHHAAPDRAERRQLTVLFADLVGSTPLAACLDPEEMRQVMRGYQNAVAGEIARFDGYVAKFMGDGVLAYFGWPAAHEDEAERAVRAGLAIVEAVGGMTAPGGQPLAARIGIATGLVVVGDLLGEGAAQEQSVVGDTPNLAARLQAIAGEGQVVISDQTRRLVGSRFDIDDLGPHPLKGLEQPVPVFRVRAARNQASRFDTRAAAEHGAIFGRTQELALLGERWSSTVAGEGQCVLLVGEPGIGKSRLARALVDSLAGQSYTELHYQCSPYHGDSALWPVVEQLNHSIRSAHGVGAEAQLDTLESLLRVGTPEPGEAPALIASLLGIETTRYGALQLSPQVLRHRTLNALVRQLLGLAAQKPVLLMLEDVHWVDPTTLELVDLVLDSIGSARVMLLLTSRPDNEPVLAGHPLVTRLTLNRLGRAAVEAITARLCGSQRLPATVLQEIASRTDGVPLYVEELTRAVLELGQENLFANAVPATLHDSLMARLDRVPEVKRVAQVAACIGREFDYQTLGAVVGLPAAALDSALVQLRKSELVFRRGDPPDAVYTFKHALVRDAAANSLLHSERRRIHGALADVFAAERPPRPPELIAQHAEIAMRADEAIRYWGEAGRAAAARYANAEAVRYFDRALRLIMAAPHDANRDRMELEVLVAMGVPLIATRGYASDEVERTYSRARTLCEAAGDLQHLFFVLRGLWNCALDRADLALSLEIAQRLLAIALERRDPALLALGYRALGTTRLNRGECEPALDAFRRGMAAAQDLPEDAGSETYGEAPALICRAYAGWTLAFVGQLDQALAMVMDAHQAARRSGHPVVIAFVTQMACNVLMMRREHDECLRLAEAARELSEEHLLVFWVAGMSICIGWANARGATLGAGLEQFRKGIEQWQDNKATLHLPTWCAYYADALMAAGRVADAEATVDLGLATARRNADVVFLGELLRLKGMVASRLGRGADAVKHLTEAGAVAREQGARLFELRAARDLAQLLHEQGNPDAAYALLSGVYGAFSEGLDTADLVEAKHVLDASSLSRAV